MLAMWVPELPFQLACGRDGGLKARPLAFLNPENPRTPSLWFVNRLGRAAGLGPGLPMDQALRRVPGLRVLDPSPQVWWEAQGSLGDLLQHWTPQGQLGRLGEASSSCRAPRSSSDPWPTPPSSSAGNSRSGTAGRATGACP